ncbi:hypothetical protein Tco_0852134 [Tanacetum coccineum]
MIFLWSEVQEIDDDEVISEEASLEFLAELKSLGEKRAPTIINSHIKKETLDDMMQERCKIAAENPNEPPMFLWNKDLFYLNHGNTEAKKYILSLHKIHVTPFLEDDLEELLTRWVDKVFKRFNEEACLSIKCWKSSWAKIVYRMKHYKVRTDHREVYSNQKIVEVIKSDYKYLNKNDIEDMYLMCLKRLLRVIHSTSISRPQLKCYQVKEKVMPNISQVKFTKKEVEDHHRIFSISKKTKSVTACNDSSNSRTSNVNAVCAECGKCVEKFLGTVRFGNDQFAPILGYGDLIQGNVTIKRVYYVEGLNHNLFSVGQFCDADLEVAFRKSTCFVRDLQGNDLL